MKRPDELDRLLRGTDVIAELVNEVREAGALACKLYEQGVARSVQTKPDRSPVTEADRAVEARLRAFVARRFPAAAILGEEQGASGVSDAVLRFVVDPIDGTRAFVRGIPTWSVLVGIELRGEPVVGVAFMPAADEMFVAVVGEGATCNGRPLRVSTIDSLDDAVVSHGGLNQFRMANVEPLLQRLAAGTYSQYGFSDFDGYRKLLNGSVDAMVDPGVKPWDLCAACVLVRAAGGRLTTLNGTATIYGGSGLATNGRIHDAMVRLLA